MKYCCIYESPIGPLTLVCNDNALTNLDFGAHASEDAALQENHPILAQTRNWLDIYFSGQEPGFMPPIELSGSEFRQMVGHIMLNIPFGHTITYGDIAREVQERTGKRASAQAVGNAVGHNPIAIIVPCHRVVGYNGSLTGYGGGMDNKIRLLENENIDFRANRLFDPRTRRQEA